MAIVNEYQCIDCGFEMKDDGRVFILDESGETKDFLILMNTCHWLDNARVSGGVSETYCSDCDKYLKIYTINEVGEGIENPQKKVRKGIEKHISKMGAELQKLKDIRKKSEYTIEKVDYYYIFKIPEYSNFYYSSYLLPEMTREDVIKDALNDFYEEIDEVIDEMDECYNRFINANYVIEEADGWEDEDLSQKVKCPECGKEIVRHISSDSTCPKCGGRSFLASSICYD